MNRDQYKGIPGTPCHTEYLKKEELSIDGIRV